MGHFLYISHLLFVLHQSDCKECGFLWPASCMGGVQCQSSVVPHVVNVDSGRHGEHVMELILGLDGLVAG